MLTFDSLLEQAKVRGMPLTKIRGILREYLQVLILKECYKDVSGKKLLFTGGTYLRLTHNLKRFSEDLDFNAAAITKSEFEQLVKRIGKELKRTGIEAKIEFAHWGKIYVSKLIFSDIERAYNVVSKYSKKTGIVIKFESNRPNWKIKSETQLISGFGELYPCICTQTSALFADKIDAFLKKGLARHLFDIIFMLSNRYPIDRSILSGYGIKKDPLEAILDKIKSLSGVELKKLAEDLRPFLFDEAQADIIARANTIMPLLLEKYSQK